MRLSRDPESLLWFNWQAICSPWRWGERKKERLPLRLPPASRGLNVTKQLANGARPSFSLFLGCLSLSREEVTAHGTAEPDHFYRGHGDHEHRREREEQMPVRYLLTGPRHEPRTTRGAFLICERRSAPFHSEPRWSALSSRNFGSMIADERSIRTSRAKYIFWIDRVHAIFNLIKLSNLCQLIDSKMYEIKIFRESFEHFIEYHLSDHKRSEILFKFPWNKPVNTRSKFNQTDHEEWERRSKACRAKVTHKYQLVPRWCFHGPFDTMDRGLAGCSKPPRVNPLRHPGESSYPRASEQLVVPLLRLVCLAGRIGFVVVAWCIVDAGFVPRSGRDACWVHEKGPGLSETPMHRTRPEGRPRRRFGQGRGRFPRVGPPNLTVHRRALFGHDRMGTFRWLLPRICSFSKEFGNKIFRRIVTRL